MSSCRSGRYDCSMWAELVIIVSNSASSASLWSSVIDGRSVAQKRSLIPWTGYVLDHYCLLAVCLYFLYFLCFRLSTKKVACILWLVSVSFLSAKLSVSCRLQQTRCFVTTSRIKWRFACHHHRTRRKQIFVGKVDCRSLRTVFCWRYLIRAFEQCNRYCMARV